MRGWNGSCVAVTLAACDACAPRVHLHQWEAVDHRNARKLPIGRSRQARPSHLFTTLLVNTGCRLLHECDLERAPVVRVTDFDHSGNRVKALQKLGCALFAFAKVSAKLMVHSFVLSCAAHKADSCPGLLWALKGVARC